MTTDVGPFGIGDFSGSAVPGAGSGSPHTDSQVDIMLVPSFNPDNITPNTAIRVRLKGFSHQMPVQDILDSIGGEQPNDTANGGRRVWGISNNHAQAYRAIGLAGAASSGSSAQSEANLTLQAWKRDLNEPDQVSPLAAGENVLAVMNGNNNLLLLKGDGRLVKFGNQWVAPAFSASNFQAGAGQIWDVSPGNVATYEYSLNGNKMTFNFCVNASTIGGTPNPALVIKIPDGFLSAKELTGYIHVSNNGVASHGYAQLVAGNNSIFLYKDASGAANWAGSTGNNYVSGGFTFRCSPP